MLSGFALLLSGAVLSGKEERTYYDTETMAKVRAKISQYPWAKQQVEAARRSAAWYLGKTDDELVAFIKVGRDPSDPLNTTGVAMPPKAGNPALTDDDLYDVVAFVRTLQK